MKEIIMFLVIKGGSVCTGDFNNDGKIDVVSANAADNTISVFINDNDISFLPQQPYAVGMRPEYVIVGDFNNDKYLDIAVTNEGSNNVSILLNLGNGSFSTQITYSVGNNP